MRLNAMQRRIVAMFRKMSDAEVWPVIKSHVAGDESFAAAAAKSAKAAAPKAAPKTRAKKAGRKAKTRVKAAPKAAKKAARKAAPKAAPKGTRKRRTSAERAGLLASVEAAVKGSKGMSASQIAAKVKAPQPRVAAALRELKNSKRIHQGGERRFARYAGDAKTAKAASLAARKK